MLRKPSNLRVETEGMASEDDGMHTLSPFSHYLRSIPPPSHGSSDPYDECIVTNSEEGGIVPGGRISSGANFFHDASRGPLETVNAASNSSYIGNLHTPSWETVGNQENDVEGTGNNRREAGPPSDRQGNPELTPPRQQRMLANGDKTREGGGSIKKEEGEEEGDDGESVSIFSFGRGSHNDEEDYMTRSVVLDQQEIQNLFWSPRQTYSMPQDLPRPAPPVLFHSQLSLQSVGAAAISALVRGESLPAPELKSAMGRPTSSASESAVPLARTPSTPAPSTHKRRRYRDLPSSRHSPKVARSPRTDNRRNRPWDYLAEAETDSDRDPADPPSAQVLADGRSHAIAVAGTSIVAVSDEQIIARFTRDQLVAILQNNQALPLPPPSTPPPPYTQSSHPIVDPVDPVAAILEDSDSNYSRDSSSKKTSSSKKARGRRRRRSKAASPPPPRHRCPAPDCKFSSVRLLECRNHQESCIHLIPEEALHRFFPCDKIRCKCVFRMQNSQQRHLKKKHPDLTPEERRNWGEDDIPMTLAEFARRLQEEGSTETPFLCTRFRKTPNP